MPTARQLDGLKAPNTNGFGNFRQSIKQAFFSVLKKEKWAQTLLQLPDKN